MELIKKSKNIKSLIHYGKLTEEAYKMDKFSKIELNFSVTLILKKIQIFEVKYFVKHGKNGLACIIFEQLLALPTSKTWQILGSELVYIVKLWLNEIKGEILKSHSNWWTFTGRMLTFIKDLKTKDASLLDILTEHLSESLFDLVTQEKPDVWQKFEILHCLNFFCSESSRQIRFALRPQFEEHFIKLSTYMSSCGHLPCQFSIIETLLRWLVPRNDCMLRSTSALKWFPTHMYRKETVDIFIERPWLNFFQDARDLLNTHNEQTNLIVSVLCKKITIGQDVIASTQSQELWFDINSATNCISVILTPHILQKLKNIAHVCCEMLIVRSENTEKATLLRESLETILSIKTITPPVIEPSRMIIQDVCDVTIVLSSKINLYRLDAALKKIFDSKYHLNIDLNEEFRSEKTSQYRKCPRKLDSDNFSQPVQVPWKRRGSGIQTIRGKAFGCKSPSSVSTSSLVRLPEKLAALPKFTFEGEPVTVCARPNLSSISELVECDEESIKTCKFSNYGVRHNVINRKIQKDQNLNKTLKSNSSCASPKNVDDLTSCLLMATLGSSDESVINDTLERLNKNVYNRKNNIVDTLIQEALESQYKDKIKSPDSGVITGDLNREVGNTFNVDFRRKHKLNKKCTVISKSTSDESNTEIVETPTFVSVRKYNKNKMKARKPVQRNEAVNNIFNQLTTENKDVTIVKDILSAKQINETASENSRDLDFCDLLNDKVNIDYSCQRAKGHMDLAYNTRTKVDIFNKIDVEECLMNLVDQVCKMFDENISKNKLNQDTGFNINNEKYDFGSDDEKPLKYLIQKKSRERPCEAHATGSPVDIQSFPDTNVRQNEQSNENRGDLKNQNIPQSNSGTDTKLACRKRKLYSPTNEYIEKKRLDNENLSDDDFQTSTCQISNIAENPEPRKSFYKDIQMEKKNRIRAPPKRRTRSKPPEPLSPKTQRNNRIFDQLKQTVENTEINIQFVKTNNKSCVYNFSSDSENGEIFDKKKEPKTRSTVKRKISSKIDKTLPKGKPTKKNKNRNNNSVSVSNTDKGNQNYNVNRGKKKTKAAKSFESLLKKGKNDLVDEKMREAPTDTLNTSILVEKQVDIAIEPMPLLHKAPEMEFADNVVITSKELIPKKRYTVRKRKKTLKTESNSSLFKTKVPLPNIVDEAESLLPELVVETIPAHPIDTKDIISVQKLYRICQEQPDIDDTNTIQCLVQNDLDDIEELKSPEAIQVPVTKPSKKPKKAPPNTIKKNENYNTDSQNDHNATSDNLGINLDSAPPIPLNIGKKTAKNIDIQEYGRSFKMFYEQLNDADKSTKDDTKIKSNSSMEKNKKSLNVCISPLSLEEIDKYLQPRGSSKNESLKSNNTQGITSLTPIDYISKCLPSARTSFTDDKTDTSAQNKGDVTKNLFNLNDIAEYNNSPSDKELSNLFRNKTSLKESSHLTIPNKFTKKSTKDRINEDINDIVECDDYKFDEDLSTAFRNDKTLEEESCSTVSDKLTKKRTKKRPNKDIVSQTTPRSFENEKDIIKTKDTNKQVRKRSRISPVFLEDINLSTTQIVKNNSNSGSEIFPVGVKYTLRENIHKPEESTSGGKKVTSSPKLCASDISLNSNNVMSKLRNINTLDSIEDASLSDRRHNTSAILNRLTRLQDINNSDENIDYVKDMFQIILEYLDKTLVESNQATSDRFLKMFSDVERNLTVDMKEKVTAHSKVSAPLTELTKELMGDQVKTLKALENISKSLVRQSELQKQISLEQQKTREDLDTVRRSLTLESQRLRKVSQNLQKIQRNMKDEFESIENILKTSVNSMKQSALGFMKQETQQRNLMVLMLKEDVQAVKDFEEKKKRYQ